MQIMRITIMKIMQKLSKLNKNLVLENKQFLTNIQQQMLPIINRFCPKNYYFKNKIPSLH